MIIGSSKLWFFHSNIINILHMDDADHKLQPVTPLTSNSSFTLELMQVDLVGMIQANSWGADHPHTILEVRWCYRNHQIITGNTPSTISISASRGKNTNFKLLDSLLPVQKALGRFVSAPSLINNPQSIAQFLHHTQFKFEFSVLGFFMFSGNLIMLS